MNRYRRGLGAAAVGVFMVAVAWAVLGPKDANGIDQLQFTAVPFSSLATPSLGAVTVQPISGAAAGTPCTAGSLTLWGWWDGTEWDCASSRSQGMSFLGTGTSLQTSATTAYWYPTSLLASTTTEANAELPAPFTETVTQISCGFSAAQGSAKSDAVTFVDVTSACGTPPTCTATNATSCSATGDSCAVTAGDLLAFKDVTTGASISARNATCIVMP